MRGEHDDRDVRDASNLLENVESVLSPAKTDVEQNDVRIFVVEGADPGFTAGGGKDHTVLPLKLKANGHAI